jgi:hypothetical protein
MGEPAPLKHATTTMEDLTRQLGTSRRLLCQHTRNTGCGRRPNLSRNDPVGGLVFNRRRHDSHPVED